MIKLTLRQLEVFAAVARNLSFVRTAEELYLTAPAVSMQVKQLESSLGLPLFHRNSGGVELTMAGEYMLVHARRMLANAKEIEDLAARLLQADAGRVTLGILGTAKYFVPQMLTPFIQHHPAVELRLSEGNRRELIESLERNEVDLAVMGRPPRELQTLSEPFAPHPLGVVAATNHPLAHHARVTPDEIAGEPFIIREAGSGTRAAMEECFKNWRISPPVIMRMGSNETIKQAVMAGMGLAFLSLHTVASEIERGQLRMLPIHGLPFMRQWHLIHVRSRVLSPAAEALRYHLLENGSEFLARHFRHVNPTQRH